MPSLTQGLNTQEATKKLKDYGFNEIIDSTKSGPIKILFRQVQKNSVVYMLLASAIISFLVGKNVTAYTVLAVIVAVISIGFVQEYKAEEAINSLKKMIMPVSIVFRDGKKKEVPARELVPGDIVLLGNGEKIPADCVILEEHELRVNESTLTGESKEISKDALLSGDAADINKVYMGTYIVNGRAVAQVSHTGMNTKFGKIAHLISTAEKELPLQEKINKITKYMVIVAIVAASITGLLMLYRAGNLSEEVLITVLIAVVAMSVSSFPEGFPVVLATTLAVGAKRMSAKNAIVNRMSIIETLGEATIICSDKTGTITRGEMTVKFIFTGEALYQVEGTGYIAHGNVIKDKNPIDTANEPVLQKLITTSLLCTDAEIERTGTDQEYKAIGTPTEAALLILGAKTNTFKENLSESRVEERPFNSERKMMSILASDGSEYTVCAKGAPEILLEKCSKYLKNGVETDLTPAVLKTFKDLQTEMAANAYRTLAIAYKKLNSADKNYTEEDLVLLGVVSMEDPPREEVKEALLTAARAGIKVRMITGDNKETALAIAKQIGLGSTVLEGKDLDQLSDTELQLALKNTHVFARVKPEHKIRIVKALKDSDEIVAMTGDGVNDAPALKEAHIGIAMGKNGTDVSRSVADLTLKDDNFATIIDAIAEGRTVFNNIRKFVTYQLSCNFAEISILFIGVIVAPFLDWSIPLITSIQILFMNLVTDNLPSITLGLNPTSKDIMEDQPHRNAQILNKTLIKLLIVTGMVMCVLTLSSFYVSHNVLGHSKEVAQTLALASLIIIEIGTAFSFRSFRKMAIGRSLFVNQALAIASFVSIMATLLIVYTPLSTTFETVYLKPEYWLIPICLTIVAVAIHDIIKNFNLKNKEYLLDTR